MSYSRMSYTDVLRASAPGYSQRFLENIAAMWKESCFCDVTILIGKRQFQAHKTILAAASPFFKAMFSSGMEEEHRNEIELHEMSTDIFSKIISFIYTGNLFPPSIVIPDILCVLTVFV